MGKGWEETLRVGRRDRLRQEVLHRVAGGPPPFHGTTQAATALTPAITARAGTPSIQETSSGSASDIRKYIMYKTLNTDWLKRTLLQVILSGWTVIVLLAISLLLCSSSGRPAFCVWWLAFSGTCLMFASYLLGNLPYRLLLPGKVTVWWSSVLSWIIWGVAVLLLTMAPLPAKQPVIILFYPLAGLTATCLYLWISCREPFKWTR